MLYIVATPIGNLEDITLRALEVLKSVDLILCEDTRVSRKLLDHYEIKNKKLITYHQHTDTKKIGEIIELIKNNNVALITDAGTPGIADPGNKLINEIVGAQNFVPIQIIPIPGPSALITALSISGLPTDKFIFKGFVPHKKGRETFLREVLEAKETVVFYESCHRIIKTLSFLCHPELSEGSHSSLCHSDESQNPEKKDYGSRVSEELPVAIQARDDNKKQKHLVVCRELTKKFETIYRGTAEEILIKLKQEFKNNTPKGEFVVVTH